MGLGSGAIVASTLLPLPGVIDGPGASKDIFTFKAVTGLPAENFPSYASLVHEGSVNLKTQTGIVTRTVYAGPPEAMSTIAWPGLSQSIRVTSVSEALGELHITGAVDDRSQLNQGESPNVEIHIDPSTGVVRTEFLSSNVASQPQIS